MILLICGLHDTSLQIYQSDQESWYNNPVELYAVRNSWFRGEIREPAPEIL